ncbi:MAG: DUF6198 family protein [Eubacteriales bacterium]|nr:DUF6198 family protein [Eubacteriales bacterium]
MKITRRILVYCLGLLLLAIGVTFSIKSNLGVSPVNSLPYVLSLIVGIEIGKMSIIVNIFLILVQVILLRKKFKLRNLTQILFSFAFGFFLTFSNWVFRFITVQNYFMRLGLLSISIGIIAMGVMLYLKAELVPMPAEGCMIAIRVLLDKEFYKIKMAVDSSFVLLASILSLIAFHELIGVREGTILAAIFIGKIIGIFEKRFGKQLKAVEDFIR